MSRQQRIPLCRQRPGFSLLETLAVVTILGVIAFIVMPRFSQHSSDVKRSACHTIKANLDIQAQLWYRNKNRWPASDLSDLASNADYLPDGLPTCPADGSAYVFDSSSERISGHAH